MTALITNDAEELALLELGLELPTMDEIVGLRGYGYYTLTDENGELKDAGFFKNLITQIGDQYYGERAAGIASPPGQATGMQLGTGTTTPAKTSTGAAIVTLVAASLVAIDASFPTSALNGSSRRIQWKTTWPAGTATASGIAEVALVNQSTGTQTVAPAAATISRALLSPTVNKGASDTLAVTWNHDLLGA
jgi:hypothetical protein